MKTRLLRRHKIITGQTSQFKERVGELTVRRVNKFDREIKKENQFVRCTHSRIFRGYESFQRLRNRPVRMVQRYSTGIRMGIGYSRQQTG